jgi:hypothetical protein
MVGLLPFLLAATKISGGAVDALLGDDPLLAVALGDTTADAVQISVEASLGAGGVSPIVAIAAAGNVDSTKRLGKRNDLVARICGVAEIRARWPLVAVAVRHGLGGGGVLLSLHRHVLGLQSLATLVDQSVALDENVGLDVSSVGDLAGASGGIDLAGAVVGDLHAGIDAIVVDAALAVAGVVGSNAISILAREIMHIQIGLQFFQRFAGVDHSVEFGLDGHALVISDAHLLHGVLADVRSCDGSDQKGKHY